MKRLLFLPVMLMSILVCGTALAADITGTYVNKYGTVVIEKSKDANLIKVKFKNGYINELVSDRQNSDSWVEKTILKKADNAYYVTFKSKDGQCVHDKEGLTILKGSTLTTEGTTDGDWVFNVDLDKDGISLNIPVISFGTLCVDMGRDKFKKK